MKVFAFSDPHFPWVNMKKLKAVYGAIKVEKPDVVINLGDLYDLYMFSRFSKDLDIIKPRQELCRSRRKAEEMWSYIKEIAPDAQLLQMSGNHDARCLNLIKHNAPQLLSTMREAQIKYFTFKGVKTYYSERDYVEFDGVVYCHGWYARGVQRISGTSRSP